MFGKFVRATLTIGACVLLAAIMRFIVPYLLPYQGASDSLLYRSFTGITDNVLLIMLLAIGAGILARAIVESDAGVR